MKSNKKLIIFLFLFFVIKVDGQDKVKDEYFFPVRPGEINFLSGTMGEIRPSHFHAGMDIKTSGISGLPVYATKEGYIERIRVSGNGYGNVLYIKHPNGESSVYGHLLSFSDQITSFVIDEQYKKESFEVNLFPKPNQFPVKKGELIALSGNTGSSQGPHLHFEIRNKDQWPLNPLKKVSSAIQDKEAPIVYGIALKTLDINSRIENQFGRVEYKVKNNGSGFSLDKSISVWGHIGLQIMAYDKFSGANNRNGVPYIDVYLDSIKTLEIKIDSFSFSHSTRVPHYYDYEARIENRKTFQKLYIDDGIQLPIYSNSHNKGIFDLRDGKDHTVKVIMRDIHGNSSQLIIPLTSSVPTEKIENIRHNINEEISYSLSENILQIVSLTESGELNHAFLYANRMSYELVPSYFSDKRSVFLWDMKLGIPDSVEICGKSIEFNYEVMIPSEIEFNFYNKVFDIKSFRNSLYDTMFLETGYRQLDDSGLEIFTIGNNRTPVANSLEITFKPKKDYQNNEKNAVFSTVDFNNFSFEGNKWSDNEIKIRTKNLGSFTILPDTIAPDIRALRISRDKISFSIRDNLSGIKEYKAYLDGEWLLFNFDPKRNYIWSQPKNPNKSLQGELKLTVEDNCGNINEFKTQIN